MKKSIYILLIIIAFISCNQEPKFDGYTIDGTVTGINEGWVKLIENKNVTTYKQNEIEEKPAPKIHTETCKVDWSDSLDNIYNMIRGLNPYPAAWTILKNGNEER